VLFWLKLSRVVDTEGFLARVFCFDIGMGFTNVTREFTSTCFNYQLDSFNLYIGGILLFLIYSH
jgi:hypothetical protein